MTIREYAGQLDVFLEEAMILSLEYLGYVCEHFLMRPFFIFLTISKNITLHGSIPSGLGKTVFL